MYFRYPINDVHIHLFDPKDMDECTAMVDECGYTNWAFLACTVIGGPFALTQNLLCALMKLREGGRCQAFGSFHYNGDQVPDADNLLRQIEWFDKAGFDGIKMLDGKPGVRRRQNLPLDAPNYDKMFYYAQLTKFPILYHINDPISSGIGIVFPSGRWRKISFTVTGVFLTNIRLMRKLSDSCTSIPI